MGTFSVNIELQGMNGGESASVIALVDTGSSYTVLGGDFLEQLGIEPIERQLFQLGDDRLVEYDMGEVRLFLDGRRRATPVVFGGPGVSPLLGGITLQEFRLIADSVNDRLVPMPPIQARPI
jgi:predicted aspartyl protease